MMIVNNADSVLNAGITDRALLLKDLLEMDDIIGFDADITEKDDIEVFYNRRYFEVKDEIIKDKEEHEYTEELDELENIDFQMNGKLINVSMFIHKTEETNKLDYLLSTRNNMGMSTNMYPSLLTFNDSYFKIVDGKLDVQPSIKKYITIKEK